jgi:membrane peptidoglycan carboxypeptidase
MMPTRPRCWRALRNHLVTTRPSAKETRPILRRRNQILALMAAQGFISRGQMTAAEHRPLPPVIPHESQPFQSSAVVAHVLDELKVANPDLSLDDLLQGQIQVHATVDARVQRIVTDALEHGLQQYEHRHPGAAGMVQGSVVVLNNRDGSVLAETGGRQVYRGRATSYSDFNRVRQSMRQPGSAMKPIVYLAAFRHGDFTLETLVPDKPISVPTGRASPPKWIANYDGSLQGDSFRSGKRLPNREMPSRSGSRRRLGSTPSCRRHGASACRRRLPAATRRRAWCVGGQLAGARDGISNDRLGRCRPAVRDPPHRSAGQATTYRPTSPTRRRGRSATVPRCH